LEKRLVFRWSSRLYLGNRLGLAINRQYAPAVLQQRKGIDPRAAAKITRESFGRIMFICSN